ncbi:MAG: hypothetical protein R3A13_11400 [Bdellovibrionota bacterium]
MERFLVLTTTTDEYLAKRIVGLLEEKSIEVILEHVEISDGNLRAAGYRILAKSDKVQAALNLVETVQEEYFASEAEFIKDPQEEAA